MDMLKGKRTYVTAVLVGIVTALQVAGVITAEPGSSSLRAVGRIGPRYSAERDQRGCQVT